MKLTKKQILELNEALASVGNLSGVKFAYAVARNLDKLKPEVDALNKAIAVSEEYAVYDKARLELVKQYAVKNPDGSYKTVPLNNSMQYIIKDEEAFQKALDELRKNHPAFAEREQLEKDYEILLKEEADVDLYIIPLSYIPEGIITAQMNGILPIIADEVSPAVPAGAN